MIHNKIHTEKEGLLTQKLNMNAKRRAEGLILQCIVEEIEQARTMTKPGPTKAARANPEFG